eukprot:COSAG06_NODE_4317_length_4368_cov_3.983134_2_plen_52_part_00
MEQEFGELQARAIFGADKLIIMDGGHPDAGGPPKYDLAGGGARRGQTSSSS